MISVITTVHNGETTIAETIESIQKQTFSKFEYILIDDGSTDNTIKIIEHYKEKDPRIKLVSTQKIGRSAALNLAIKNARYNYIANIDADDIAYPDRLQLQYDFFQIHDDVALVSSKAKIVYENQSILPNRKIDMARFSQLTSRNLKRTNPIPHSSVMFNLNNLKLEDLYYSENIARVVDYELWIRLVRQDYKLVLFEDYLVTKRIHPNQSFENKNRREYLRTVYKIQTDGFKGDLSVTDKSIILIKYLYGLLPQNFRMKIRR